MTVARALEPRSRTLILMLLALLAWFAVEGCEKVSGPQDYPARPEDSPRPYLFGIWGTNADDVYVVGQPGLIYHWDGTTWTLQDSHTSVPLTSVWGDSTGRMIYATGHGGVILRKPYLGGEWSAMTSGTDEDLYDIGEFFRGNNPANSTILAAGYAGTLLELANDVWHDAPDTILIRDDNGAPADTLSRKHDCVSFTSVFPYGIGGAYLATGRDPGEKGITLMNDPDSDWQLRRIAGGEGWITSAAGVDSNYLNFVASDRGRLFRSVETEPGVLSWDECYSPALGEIVYGLWLNDQFTVYAVSNTGRISLVTREYRTRANYTELRNDGKALFDIWGTSSDNLYAVGINITDNKARVLHYYIDPEATDPTWHVEELDVPVAKTMSAATSACDKFGRPLF